MRIHWRSFCVLVFSLAFTACNTKPGENKPGGPGGDPGPAPAADVGKTDITTTADTASAKRISQIAHGMHNFASATADANSLPTQSGITYKNGKSEKVDLSWRVMLLPYIGEEKLYKKFKLDEPWDSPNNKPLVEQMPAIYANPKGNAKKGETYIKIFAGGGAWFFPESWPGSSKLTPQDGASNTILIAEGGDPVIWTKPDDFTYDPSKPLPNLTPPDGSHKLNIAMGDGATYTIDLNKVKKNDKNFRAAITSAGGEVFDDTWADSSQRPNRGATQR